MNNRRFSPKLLRGILQIGVSVVLLAIVLRRVDWRELQAALAQMSLPWLAAAWALFLLGVVVRAFRWQTLLLALDVRAPLRQLTLWYFVGGFFNVILPTGFGGDAVRVIELGHDTQRTGAVLTSVVVDRYLGLIALLGMGVFAGLLRPDLAPGYVPWRWPRCWQAACSRPCFSRGHGGRAGPAAAAAERRSRAQAGCQTYPQA